MEAEVICPLCGSKMVLRTTDKFKYPNGDSRKFYGCSQFPNCKAVHGAHPDGRPLGIPGNAETKQWRMNAHAKFDILWKQGYMSRRKAYQTMRELMGLSEKEAHIGMFTIEQCQTLISKIEDFLSSHREQLK